MIQVRIQIENSLLHRINILKLKLLVRTLYIFIFILYMLSRIYPLEKLTLPDKYTFQITVSCHFNAPC